MVLLLAAAAVGQSPAWAADAVLPNFIPADTKVVMGFQVRRILDSPVGKSMATDAAKVPTAQLAGIDFLKDVDEVLVATTAAGQNPPALLVLKGRFHVTPGKRYHGVSIAEDPAHATALVAILNESTAIAGEAEQVHAAIDRRGRGAPAAALSARIQALADRYDIWGAGDHLPKPAQAGQWDSVDGFSFGAALRQGLELTAEIHLRSAADAEKMTASLKPIEAMLKARSGSTKFDLQAKGGTLQLSLAVPEAELKKGIEAQKAAFAAALAGQMGRMGQTSLPKPKSEGRILTDSQGNTVSVTLPGGFE
jgi:hypothetical protein